MEKTSRENPTNLDGGCVNSMDRRIRTCPMCRAGDGRLLQERLQGGKLWGLVRCRKCGLHFTSPQPSGPDIAGFYSGAYHGDIRVAGATEKVFGEKFNNYADWIQGFVIRGRALDIGCSTGLLVRILRDRGFQAEGIELNDESASWGRRQYGVTIHSEPLHDGMFEEGTFSLIVMADLLEHTPHPLEYLGLVCRILSKEGYLFVTLPDIRSLESRYWYLVSKLTRREALWRTCHFPLHIWEFTKPTAENCFRQAGFEIAAFTRIPSPPDQHWGLLKLLSLPVRPLNMRCLASSYATSMQFLLRRADVEC